MCNQFFLSVCDTSYHALAKIDFYEFGGIPNENRQFLLSDTGNNLNLKIRNAGWTLSMTMSFKSETLHWNLCVYL